MSSILTASLGAWATRDLSYFKILWPIVFRHFHAKYNLHYDFKIMIF